MFRFNPLLAFICGACLMRNAYAQPIDSQAGASQVIDAEFDEGHRPVDAERNDEHLAVDAERDDEHRPRDISGTSDAIDREVRQLGAELSDTLRSIDAEFSKREARSWIDVGQSEREARTAVELQAYLPEVAASRDLRLLIDARTASGLDGWLSGGSEPDVDWVLEKAALGLLRAADVVPVSDAEPLYAKSYILDVVGCRVSPTFSVLNEIAGQLCPAEPNSTACFLTAQRVLADSMLIQRTLDDAGADLNDWVRASESECRAVNQLAWVAHLEYQFLSQFEGTLDVAQGGIGMLGTLLESMDDTKADALLERLQGEGQMSPTRLAEFGSAGVCQQPGLAEPQGAFGTCGMPNALDVDGLPQAPPGIPGPDPLPTAMSVNVSNQYQGGALNGMEPMNGDTWAASDTCRNINPKYLFGASTGGSGDDLSTKDQVKLEALAENAKKQLGNAEKIATSGATFTEIIFAVQKASIAVIAVNIAKAIAPSVGEAVLKSFEANLKRTDDAIRKYDREAFSGGTWSQDPTAGFDETAAKCGAQIALELVGCIFPVGSDPAAAPGGMVCESTLESPIPGPSGIAPILTPEPGGTGGMTCICGGVPTAQDYADAPEYDAECIASCGDEDISCYEMCNPGLHETFCSGEGMVPGGALALVCGAYDPSPVDDPEGSPDGGPEPCPSYDLNCEQGMEPGPPYCLPGTPGCP